MKKKMIENYIIYFMRYLYIFEYHFGKINNLTSSSVVEEQRAEECEFSYPANDDRTEIEF